MIEPPINRDPLKLAPEFWGRLEPVLAQLAAEGTPFYLLEGFRTSDRQHWIWGSGRPKSKYGRTGPIVTKRDGIRKLSNHQSGRAADCYPADPITGKLIWPPPPNDPAKSNFDPRWERYATLLEEHGLSAGFRWKQHDPPHAELLLVK